MTSAREALLEKLVDSLHLDLAERRMLGSNSVSIEEVSAVVKRLLGHHGIFPPQAGAWHPGATVFEGFFLVNHPDGTVTMTWQHSNPIRPTELADHGSTEFHDADAAVSAFIRKEWSAGIDGIS